MENIYYRLLPKEDREKLIEQLAERSSDLRGIAVEMGVPQRGYHLYILQNGAGVMSSKDNDLIQMGVRDSEHARQTRNLLSYIGNIPRDKFIPVN